MTSRSNTSALITAVFAFALFNSPALGSDLQIFLLMGQSNMEGRSFDSSAPTYLENPNILVQTYNGSWKTAKDPVHSYGVGPALSFAKNYVEHFPDRRIAFLPMAMGGTSIERWVKGADLYKRTLKQVAKIEGGQIAGILWHQGESDTESDARSAQYQTNLDSLITDIRAQLGQPELPFIVGELGHWLYAYPDRAERAKVINAALKDTPNRVHNTGFASAKGLVNGDKWHFTVTDIRTLGERYFLQYLSIIEGSPQ